jgi:hypothetical protein
MELYTTIEIKASKNPISHTDKLQLFGSCFVENVGARMKDAKFDVDINPFGTLYNPLSISKAINSLIDEKVFTKEDLFLSEGTYKSFLHHSRFSSLSEEETLKNINQSAKKGAERIRVADKIIITFGSAYVYRLKESGEIVANCHKLPEREFDRRILSSDEITNEWSRTIERILEINPNVKLILTVSPIRHWRDGAHANQVSKATLLIAVDKIMREYGEITEYFPSYEIMMDELRDYRFYTEDMIHPSSLAIDYIWERFSETFVSKQSKEIMAQWEKILKMLSHRPLQPQSDSYKAFLSQTLLKMEQFRNKFPFFDISNEIHEITNRI